MTQVTGAVIVFGGIILVALIMFLAERRGMARRKAARGGREVDVWSLVTTDNAATDGTQSKDTR